MRFVWSQSIGGKCDFLGTPQRGAIAKGDLPDYLWIRRGYLRVRGICLRKSGVDRERFLANLGSPLQLCAIYCKA